MRGAGHNSPHRLNQGRRDCFTLEGVVKILGNNKIQVPVIGVLKTYERLPQEKPKSVTGSNTKKMSQPYNYEYPSTPTDQQTKAGSFFRGQCVTISRQADRWFISFRYDLEPFDPFSISVVGVDLGVKNLATLSTGEVIEGAKSYKKYESRLSRMQWLNRHKVIGSANWKKAQMQIARLHRKIANIRKDTLHKLTSLLTKNHGTVIIEDLNVSGMMANHKLAKSIQDMGFFEFRRQLTYKCELYGSKLVVADRWLPSSKTCSRCGRKKETLTLKERVMKCAHCGFAIDRDLNAARNLSYYVADS